ncbi:MAG: hypothetical protein OXC46_10850 [Thaumarchaeota archaeon]|nr:hypothetical protein [Nitrososphaerota archaeon]
MDFLNSPGLIAVMIGLSIIASSILTSKSNTRYRKVSEIDIIMRLNDRIYDSKRGKKIIEMIKDPNKAIVDLEHKDGRGRDITA